MRLVSRVVTALTIGNDLQDIRPTFLVVDQTGDQLACLSGGERG